MQNTGSTSGSHHPIASTGRSVAGVVALVCAALAGALLGLVIADFVSEVYVGSEVELGAGSSASCPCSSCSSACSVWP